MNVRRFFTLQALARLVRRLVIAVGIYALLGFVVIPRVGRSVAEKKLTELLHRKTKIEPSEYAGYLALAYKDESFPKPRNVLGMAKDLPASEMEKLMLTHLTVTDDDLRTLAQQRAQEVKDQLAKAKIEAERIFVVEPRTLAAEKKDKLKQGRVDFVIK